MDRQDRLAAPAVGQIHMDPPIEPAGTHQGSIQDIWAVRRRQQDHPGVFRKAIHLRQELVQGLLALIVTAPDPRAALAADGIDLVDKDDAGSLLLGLAEEIADAARTNTNKHLNKFGGGHREEGHTRLTGNRLGQEGLTRPWRPHQEDALRDARANGREAFGLLQESHHFLEFFLGFVDAGDIFKTNRHRRFWFGHAGLASAKTHRAIGHLTGAANQEGQAREEQQQQQAVGDQAGRRAVLPVIADREWDLRLLGRAQQDLIVTEDRHLGAAAIGVGHLHLAAAR